MNKFHTYTHTISSPFCLLTFGKHTQDTLLSALYLIDRIGVGPLIQQAEAHALAFPSVLAGLQEDRRARM